MNRMEVAVLPITALLARVLGPSLRRITPAWAGHPNGSPAGDCAASHGTLLCYHRYLPL